MVKKLRCTVDGNDWVKAKVSDGGDLVFIQMAFRGSFSNVMLSTVNAQKLLKQIKRALLDIEGRESVEDTTPVEEPKTSETLSPRFKVGDKVRIVGPASYTDQYAFMGQVKEVSNVDITDKVATYDIAGLKGGFSFWFPASSVEPA